ncbi:hypothetical protein EQK42_19105 [Streptomyces albidoflavus]|nr:hypothetical protein C3K23_10935 [Streptomyces sp. 604F]RWZ74414.1 hypothetical protein EQK42_19105 [Streptomyces albidoflavus]
MGIPPDQEVGGPLRVRAPEHRPRVRAPLDDTPPVGAIGRGVRARRDPGGVRERRYEEGLVQGAGGGAGRRARARARGVRGAHRARLR